MDFYEVLKYLNGVVKNVWCSIGPGGTDGAVVGKNGVPTGSRAGLIGQSGEGYYGWHC
jgi:hypothetical protein